MKLIMYISLDSNFSKGTTFDCKPNNPVYIPVNNCHVPHTLHVKQRDWLRVMVHAMTIQTPSSGVRILPVIRAETELYISQTRTQKVSWAPSS